MKQTTGIFKALIVATAFIAVAACSGGNENKTEEEGVSAPPGAGSLPGSKVVTVEVSGQGYTREEAVDDALAMAVAQVNGKAFSGGNASKVRGAVKDFKILSEKEVVRKIPDRKDELSIKASESSSASYSESGSGAIAASGPGGSGAIASSGSYGASGNASRDSSLNVTTSSKGSERVWEVKVSASVMQYDGGADAGKPRIVIANPKTSLAAYTIGDTTQPADEVADRIRRSIADKVTQSNRYLVIDRSFTDEVDQELQNVMNPSANPNDIVKFGQKLTADILVVPVIEFFEYKKSVRTLKLSGRELISYAGGFKGSVAVLNVATGQLIFNETFAVEFPATEPRAFAPGVDAQGMANKMVDGLTEKFVGSLIRRTFPVSVLSMDGTTVVLNQGGSTLKQGATYELVRMGKELKDPQTKQSLGRMEQPYGTVTITRVDPNLSYGEVALKAPIPAAEFKQGMLEVRSEIAAAASATPATAASASASSAPPAGKSKPKKDEFDDFLEE
ncbi:MAG: hypothetical protein ACO329_10770 [Steroidobacteraceae bacterium]